MALAPASPMAAALLQSCSLSGSWQMAIDAVLLERREPVLRFYRWSRPTLSLGFHQKPLLPAWLRWHQGGQGDLVRRPSGGGAVLHGGDLCYALIWPDPPAGRLASYQQICSWLMASFAELGEPLSFGQEPQVAGNDCFARSTAADLVTAQGQKRIGSAQRWHRGCLLQHGSIQLEPDQQAWRALLDGPAPQLRSLGITVDELEQQLLSSARRWLALPASALPLDAELLAAAGHQLERYRAGG